MKIPPFLVEEWMNYHETKATYNIAETCVDPISLDELFAMTGTDKESFLNELCARHLSYGDITGAPALKEGIAKLYDTIEADQILTTHGAAGANHLLFYSLIQPGDRVITTIPTYQQLYSIPESLGADVKPLYLFGKNYFMPDLDKLRELATPETKMIVINNPNNPTGMLMPQETLEAIVEIAKEVDAWVLCDEVYRHLTQDDVPSPSIVDLYDKGISISSMSKVFSLAGLRLGWIATKDEDVLAACLSHHDYTHISCGMIDEAIAALALANSDKLLTRNRFIVKSNLNMLHRWVTGSKHFTYLKPKAGTTALIHFDFDMDSYEFCNTLMEKAGVLVVPGDAFSVEKCFRIGYACNPKVLGDGLHALSLCADEMK